MFNIVNFKDKLFFAALVILTVLPNLIRDMKVLLAFFTLALLLALELLAKGFPNNRALIYLCLFSILCLVYAAFSWFFGSWTYLYEFDQRYIFRHVYFSVMLPVFLFASIKIFNNIGPGFYSFIDNNSALMLAFIFFVDILTAFLFGDELFYLYNEYTYYLDKGFIWLFVAFLSFYSIFYSRKSTIVIAVIIIGFFAQNASGFGTMFNAATGKVVFLLILLNYFVLRLKKNFQFCYIMNFCALIAVILFVLISPFFSEFFINDINTYWRLESWYNNIIAMFSNYGFGSGFGVSYFPITNDVIDAAFKAYSSEGANVGLLEQVFVRGQHSSIINILFRTGILGLLLFICFITSSILKMKMNNSATFSIPVAICAVFNVGTHVGLESPPFMISFAIAFGYLISTNWRRSDS